MNRHTRHKTWAPNRVVAAVFTIAAACQAGAQTTGGGAPGTASEGGLAARPSPYYIGASQGIYYDSNPYRVPFGPSDVFSTTSLLAGFDQPISRQRVYGTATLSYNRYRDEAALNNTSYSLLAGVDWETAGRLSGNVTATLNQQLASPVAGGDATPVETRNLQRLQGFSGLARWGGDALLTLEARYAHTHVDYSAEAYDFGEQTSDTGSLAVYYRPGARWRVGAGVSLGNVRSPQAVVLANGDRTGNSARSRSIDLLADYDNGSALSAHGRLSFTHQSNSSVDEADFSGVTGDLNAAYRATGKITLTAGASRYTGLNNSFYTIPVVTTVVATPGATPGSSGNTTTASNITNTYQNNEVTNALYGAISYAATSKISATLSGRYSRSNIVLTGSTTASGATINESATDTTRGAALNVNYAFSRALNFACSVSRDHREVSGDRGFGYSFDTAGCIAQFIWR